MRQARQTSRWTAPLRRFAWFVLCGRLLSMDAAAAEVIAIRASCAVGGGNITLADIAAQPSFLPVAWGARAIMPAPPAGEVRDYSIVAFAAALQQYPDMGEVTLRGDMTIHVRRKSIRVDPRRIEETVKAYVVANLSEADEELRVTCVMPAFPVYVAAGELTLTVLRHKEIQGQRIVCEVALNVDGHLERVLPISTDLRPLRRVWVASRKLLRGDRLSADDVRFELSPVAESETVMVEGEPLIGYEVNRPITPGQRIHRHYLVKAVCARRGDLIHVSVESDALRVVLKARALNSGRQNDQIMCLNEKSNRRLTVTLVGPREAVMIF
jgi:flagella basal body P-ring formation protein FlgA